VAALLQIGLVNAVLATLLACLAALITRKVRHPALIHWVWIIVLFKLIAPPVFEVPIEVPFPVASAAAPASDRVANGSSAKLVTAKNPRVVGGQQTDSMTTSSIGRPSNDSAAAVETAAAAQPGMLPAFFLRAAATGYEALAICSAWAWNNLVAIIGWTWIAGSVLWFLRQALTMLRYSRRLALATPAPVELQHQADELARAMGLFYRPPVLVVRDVFSPMLWGIGENTRLLFPVELLARLEPGARETLIAHELAHFRRGDHWVRAFELFVSGVFWWHPVVWWARREIEIAEEECCDAWVIKQFPTTPRWYAEALLATIDFLAGERTVLPPVATGMGHVPFLKRRLTAIMRGEAHKTMSGRELLGLLLAAVVLLPWQPGLAPAAARSSAPPALATVSEFTAAEAMQIVAEARKSAAEPLDWTDPLTAAVEKAIDPMPAAADEKPWAAAQSPDGRYVIARSARDNKISLYDSKTEEYIDLSEYHIISVSFSPDGTKFVTGGSDRVVRLWASSTGEELAPPFRGHDGPVQAVVFMRDGETVISASRDGSIKIWDLALRDEVRHVESPFLPVNCLAVSPDGRWLALGTGSWIRFEEGGRVIVLDLATFNQREPFECDRPVGAVAFKSDSNTLVSGDWQGQVTFWDVAKNKRLGITLAQYKDKITEAQFSPDNGALSSIGLDSILPEPAYEPARPADLRTFDQSASLDLGRRDNRDAVPLLPSFIREPHP
jgi:beta-lactamase regulating signal transducer with metallopeptidase domain